jgi:hypothetical protein
MPIISRSVNVVIVESAISPSVALGKDCFVECSTKCTRQSVDHSAKSRIPLVGGGGWWLGVGLARVKRFDLIH